MATLGERFGGYELLSRIGVGGMAETFRALRRGPGGIEQRVCIKRILPAWQGDERFVRMFLEEARIAAKLRHATIVQVIEAGEHEGVPFLALELIEGTDLRRLIDVQRAQEQTLPPAVVALIALELSTALELAHRDGVIHRDVSPANVLVSEVGEVKLADFGIAKAQDAERVTATGFTKGKSNYMAPEYAATGRATPASDLYSLGVTLFEAASGRRPFRAATPLAAMHRARAADRASLIALAPHVPSAFAAIVERLVQPDPAARFPSAEALFDALAEGVPTGGARRRLGALAREAATQGTAVISEERTVRTEAPAFLAEETTRGSKRPVPGEE